MKQIQMIDTTLCREGSNFSFKERIEIARHLERLAVDVIELPEIVNVRTDTLLIRTVSSFVKKSVISVAAGLTAESVENAIAAIANAAHPRIRIELPVSSIGMEYICHKKADKMLTWIEQTVSMARNACSDVEFCATDATRADTAFLDAAIRTATEAGATALTVCDDAAEQLPDDFADFIQCLTKKTTVPIYVRCNNQHGMACAAAVLAVKSGASGVKTAVGGNVTALDVFADMIQNCGITYGMTTSLRATEIHRVVKQIRWILENVKNDKTFVPSGNAVEDEFCLDVNDEQEAVSAAVAALGYDLSSEDQVKVYEEFLRVAEKKRVGAKELEAIVASIALQVPATYRLINYVINNGNIISSSAQITLEKDGQPTTGICIGDGPVDAAFRAIEQILGHHYELDDFQIQSVTEGKEAVGSALVKLRFEGKLYSGKGISTDIIGAAIRAYINAVNKIVYEEESV